MTGYTWQVQKTFNPRFPFRISIIEDTRTVLALRTQEKWPGQKGNIFCIRETEAPDETEPLELLETVPIAYLQRHGKRVEIVLDRGTKKRCDFLFLKKRTNSGSVNEQIFFRTQTGITAHRSKGSPLLYGSESLVIVIDSSERYPWTFPKADISRDKLAAGDYALVWENRYIAVVERKTFDNLLHDLYEIRVLHQKLSELSSFPNPAVVIEAQYGDFTNRSRIGDRLSPGHLSRLLGEISAMHPGVQIIYAGNRKLANAWTARFFRAVRLRMADSGLSPVEAAERPPAYVSSPIRQDLEIRKAIVEDYRQRPKGFSAREVKADFPEIPDAVVTKVIQKLKKEEKIRRVGAGSGSRWIAFGQ